MSYFLILSTQKAGTEQITTTSQKIEASSMTAAFQNLADNMRHVEADDGRIFAVSLAMYETNVIEELGDLALPTPETIKQLDRWIANETARGTEGTEGTDYE